MTAALDQRCAAGVTLPDRIDSIAKDAKFDLEGFKNVLKLRTEIEGQWGGNPPPPEKYIDLSLYDKALAGLSRL